MQNRDCFSFTLDYTVTACYLYKNIIQSEQENEIDPNTAWFVKTCFANGKY